ncbi:PDR/VanB family oxidoreductase [Nocardioides sp. BP30]|uniref:PDR/VanB family oxidoreductase n=1 Tax=Nocardioides sp. BP30 TaxID=3036374 RepID=UPI002469019F|nr:PDR/VanB family oxidoreductase [Nocardioides sp. BP30]WGL51350.1 PDR/VanB family oxidoreductase [Nocardioides sp. BP30]
MNAAQNAAQNAAHSTAHTVPDPAAEHELELRVSAIDAPADGVRRLRLVDPSGGTLPAWQPGAHVDLHLGDLVRQYSLCGDPDDASTWTVAVLREPEGRGGSSFVHDKLAEGDLVQVRGPRNHFPLLPAPRYLFVAGGIGITPLLPMIAAAEAAGAQWELAYGGRTGASMAFAQELLATYGDRVRLYPQDEVGLLPLPALLPTPGDGTLVYCCGPGPLLDAVSDLCAGWPDGLLHMEHFAPAEPLHAADDGSFEVELADAGLTLTVPPDGTILETVRAAGVTVLSSCQEGTCGTCETGVLEGVVDHRDSILTPAERAENDVMYVCVSRAAAGCPRLVLEL